MWLGEQITEHGIGNGISMILFANIISSLPTTATRLVAMGWVSIAVVIGMAALVLNPDWLVCIEAGVAI
jgi:preprotein translocase subunit SecY